MRNILLTATMFCALVGCKDRDSDASVRDVQVQRGAGSGVIDLKIISTDSVSEAVAEQQAGLAADERSNPTKEYAKFQSERQTIEKSHVTLSGAERRRLSIEACERELKSIAFIDEMNYHTRQLEPVRVLKYSYHTEHTHPNWKEKYGDNYIHSYVTYRMLKGGGLGNAQFKLCIVSRDKLEVLNLINTDIVA